ncbi:MAG: ABC transporter ATP-binding protein [Gammaproteobacteria bacterium]
MLVIEDLVHDYGEQPVLQGVDLVLERGRIGCLLGPSGCGKTTVLRCVAGFERPAAGRISAAGRELTGAEVFLPPERRRIGMVFQDYALMPHLDVAGNVAFGLGRGSRDRHAGRVTALLELVGLPGLERRFPHELSGGQQQRVALARALAPEPELLLMDEPFSNLDAGLRERLAGEVRDIIKGVGTTALVVTHDHQDAFSVADDVGVISEGRLRQWDTAYNVYHRPEDRFVAGFVGQGVWVPGIVRSPGQVETGVAMARGRMTGGLPPGTEVELLLRPDDVVHDDESPLRARVASRRFRGSQFLYELVTQEGQRLLSAVPSHHDHAVGEMIGFRIQTDHMVVFPRRETEEAGVPG